MQVVFSLTAASSVSAISSAVSCVIWSSSLCRLVIFVLHKESYHCFEQNAIMLALKVNIVIAEGVD